MCPGCVYSKIGRTAKAVVEAERAERTAKTARLKLLRLATQISLPEAEPQVGFTEELDCSLLGSALLGDAGLAD